MTRGIPSNYYSRSSKGAFFMTLSSILGFVSLAGWLMLIAGAGIAITNISQNRSGRPGILLAAAGLVVGLLFFIASTGLVEVGATEFPALFQSPLATHPPTHLR